MGFSKLPIGVSDFRRNMVLIYWIEADNFNAVIFFRAFWAVWFMREKNKVGTLNIRLFITF